jgi:hypothetical protein
MSQPTHEDLARTLEVVRAEIAALRAEVQPVCKAYEAATIGARVLKWTISILAGIATIAGAFIAWVQIRGS